MNIEVKYSYEDLKSSPDDRHRYEIFQGDLIMTPSPSAIHQIAVGNLYRLLSNFAETQGFGKVLLAPLDVYFDEETVVVPDLLFIAKSRLAILDDEKVNGVPDVIIEVISPSTEKHDRGFKFKRYAAEGVKEYWIVEPAKKVLEIYRLREKGFFLTSAFGHNDVVRSPYFQGLTFDLEEIWR